MAGGMQGSSALLVAACSEISGKGEGIGDGSVDCKVCDRDDTKAEKFVSEFEAA
jgi:hypothetical protein